jgi:molecular chaperone GrpE
MSEEKEFNEDPKLQTVDQEDTQEAPATDDKSIASEEKDPVQALEVQLAEARDKHLRLFSEFENYRRRTAKERLELIQTANESLMGDLLTVLDDFERAQKAGGESEESNGYQLIYQKLTKTLQAKGLKRMEVEQGSEFNSDFHEAITQIPAPSEALKGKVVDVIENGYYLGEKIIRYAKVVVGA